MRWILIIIFILVRAQSCKKDASIKIPACIQDKIEALKKVSRFNPPATVYRYSIHGKYFYLFSSDCCDQYNYLYDEYCKMICAPTGGITGKGNGQCPNFKQLSSDETLIWKDDR